MFTIPRPDSRPTRSLDRGLEMTRRIKDEEAKQINLQLAELKDSDVMIEKLLQDSQTFPWEQSDVINNEEMPYYALLAVQANKITSSQATTFLLYWSAVKHHARNEIISVPMFDDNALTKENLEKYFGKDTNIHLTSEQLDDLVQELKQLPLSERIFFIVPRLNQRDLLARLEDISFPELLSSDAQSRYIFSCGLMQSILNVRFKGMAVTLNPVIGLSSMDDIRLNGLNSNRDMGLHFPFVKLPNEADGEFAPWYQFSLHDYYHATIASRMPAQHRELMIILANDLKRESKLYTDDMNMIPREVLALLTNTENKSLRKRGINTAASLVDMEHRGYNPANSELPQDKAFNNPSTTFWFSVLRSFSREELSERLLDEATPVILESVKKGEAYIDINPDKSLSYLLGMFKMAANNLKQNPAAILTAGKFIEDMIAHIQLFQRSIAKARILEKVDQIKDLTSDEAVQKFVEDNIVPLFTFRNIFSVLLVALQSKNEPLASACFTYMAKNLLALAKSKYFVKFQDEHHDLIELFLTYVRDSAYYCDAFKAALKDPEQRLLLSLFLNLENINKLDSRGFTALDYAIECRNINACVVIIHHLKANPNPQIGSKAMPTLFSALYHALNPVVDLMIACGFNQEILYKNQNWYQYLNSLNNDPATYAGVTQKYYNNKGVEYKFANMTEGKLFAAAKIAARKDLSKEKIEKLHAAKNDLTHIIEKATENICIDELLQMPVINQSLYESRAQKVEWGCQRLSYEGYADIIKNQKVEDISLYGSPPIQIKTESKSDNSSKEAKYEASRFFSQSKLFSKYHLTKNPSQGSLEKALRNAAHNNMVDDVKILLTMVNNINASDYNPKTKYTALHLATLKGHKEVTEILINAGARSNIKDAKDKTGLDYAIESSDPQLINLLINSKKFTS